MRTVAILILALVAAIPIYGQEKSPKASKTQQPSATTPQQDDTARPVVIIDSGNTEPQKAGNGDSAKKDSEGYFGRLFSPENLPTILLCVIGGITLRIIWIQAVETRRAAEAALLNAEALIKAERPWFVVDCSYAPGNSDELMVQCVNMGRTPGDLCEGHCEFAVHPLDFKGPDDDFSSPFWLPLKTFLVTNDGFEIGRRSIKFLANQKISTRLDDLLEEKVTADIAGPYAIFAYGWISYWDTFTDRTAPGAKPYVTRWLFRYNGHSQDGTNKHLTRCAGNYAGNK